MTGNRIGQENEENSSVGGQKLNPNETKFAIRINSTQDLLSIFWIKFRNWENERQVQDKELLEDKEYFHWMSVFSFKTEFITWLSSI